MGQHNVKSNYREYVMARDGFNIYDSRKENSLSIINYLFLLGDILIVFITLLSFIGDEFEDLERNLAAFVWQLLIITFTVISIIIRLRIIQ